LPVFRASVKLTNPTKVEPGSENLVKILSGAREADFALSASNSLLVGWLKRLNGLNGRFALSKLLGFF
jgi:hypothetical protein